MNVAFYMDQHVPAAITTGLRQRGFDDVTAHEDGAADWDDERILQRATDLQRAAFTQDDDFLGIARRWLATSREFAGLVYAHQRAVTIGQAIIDLQWIASVLESDEMYNRIEFLPI